MHCEVQLEETKEQLELDLGDMKEALSGETDARVAATSELEARLVAKERAESDKDKAEAQFRELKQNYLGKVDALAKAQDAANDEVCLLSPHPVLVSVHVSGNVGDFYSWVGLALRTKLCKLFYP